MFGDRVTIHYTNADGLPASTTVLCDHVGQWSVHRKHMVIDHGKQWSVTHTATGLSAGFFYHEDIAVDYAHNLEKNICEYVPTQEQRAKAASGELRKVDLPVGFGKSIAEIFNKYCKADEDRLDDVESYGPACI